MNIIWIHGFSENAEAWKNLVSHFDSAHSSFLFQHCFFENKTSIKEYAEELHQFIINNDIENPVLIGHSMGGYIALEYAASKLGEISGIGLFHSTSKSDSPEKQHERDKTKILIQKHGTSVFVKAFYPNMFSESFKEKNQVFIQERIRQLSEIPAAALCSAAESMKNREDHTETLKTFDFPMFQILGKQDAFISIEDALFQTTLIKKPNVLLLNTTAHGGMYENPEICINFINNFLQTNYTL